MIVLWALLAGIGVAGAVTFCILYATRSPGWHRTGIGQNLMAMAATLAGLLLLVIIGLAVEMPPLLWIGGLATLDAVLWWRVYLLWRTQHTPS